MPEKNRILWLSVVGLLSALSIALLAFVPGIPIFPAAPFLRYDLMDIPMIVAGAVLGPIGGGLVLFIGCLIQALLFSPDGMAGFVMHFIASGVLILPISLVFRKYRSAKSLALGLLAGTVSMVLVMIPLNLIITVHWYGVPRDAVLGMMLPVTIPFNAIKAGLNSIISFGVVIALMPFVKSLLMKFGVYGEYENENELGEASYSKTGR